MLDTTKMRLRLEIPWDVFRDMPARNLVTTRPALQDTLGHLSQSFNFLMGADITAQRICVGYMPFTRQTFPFVVDVKEEDSATPFYSIYIYEPEGDRQIGQMSTNWDPYTNPFMAFADEVLGRYVRAIKEYEQDKKDRRWWRKMDL